VDWASLLPAGRPYRQLYALRIVDALRQRRAEGAPWGKRFVAGGGFAFLVRQLEERCSTGAEGEAQGAPGRAVPWAFPTARAPRSPEIPHHHRPGARLDVEVGGGVCHPTLPGQRPP